MTGKEKCEFLKKVRSEVARANGVDIDESVCEHKGECKGTCPKCEADLSKLTDEINKKRSLGKRVALAGAALGVCASMAGCSIIDRAADIINDLRKPEPDVMGMVELAGEVAYEDSNELPNPDK